VQFPAWASGPFTPPVLKTVLDQLLMAPAGTMLFLAGMKVGEERYTASPWYGRLGNKLAKQLDNNVQLAGGRPIH
jgi:hypothetical protein